MKGKWALASMAAIAAGVGVGVYSMRHRAPAAPPVSPAAPAALAAPQQITVTGKVRAAHVVGVGAAVPGTIDAFMADVGDEVYQGQELASVGSTGLESDRTDAAAAAQQAQTRVEGAEKTVSGAQLEASRARADAVRARADFDRANKTYERQRTLFAAGATPRLTFEKAGSEYESARQAFDVVDQAARSADQRVQDTLKELENARKMLADKSQQLDAASSAVDAGMVQAPVDGLIVGRKGEVGQSAQGSGDELFQIATNLYDLEVAIEPKPEVLRRMRPGQPALVIIPDLQGTGITGQVKAIQGNQAVIGFESSLPAIRPGMVADVRLRPE
ncbi:MAG: HlyD family efflux transporter periplasmic adaptor subunit [Acidobacteriia bacterium]|nr:HlyD family efflux transporter periplasmic adaptor subunit [Terriglobia bacterium]